MSTRSMAGDDPLAALPTRPASRRAYLLLLPAAAFTVLLLGWPLIQILVFSLYKHEPGQVYVPSWTIENFVNLPSAFFWNSVWRTIRMSLITTVVSVLIAYPMAYLLSRMRTRFKSALVFLLVLPLLVGSVVRTYGWIILLSRDGALMSGLVQVHVLKEPIRLLGTEFAVIVGLVDALLPFLVLPLMSSLNKVPPALEDAALVLGARPWQVWWKVLVPLSMPGLISGTVLVYILCMGALVAPLYLGGAAFQTLSTQIWSNMLATLNWPQGSAIAVFLMVLIGATAFGYLQATARVTRRLDRV